MIRSPLPSSHPRARLRAHLRAALGAGLVLCVAACSSGPDDDCVVTNQDEALACLGVPEDDTPRVDTSGKALPDGYAPLGATTSVGVSREFFLVGMRIAPPTPTGPGTPLDNRAVTVALSDDDTGQLGTTVLEAEPVGASWEGDETSTHPSSMSTRAAAAPDLDGDGLDERVVAFLDPTDPANAGVVFLSSPSWCRSTSTTTAPCSSTPRRPTGSCSPSR